MDEPSVSPHRVTQLLEQWSHGDDAALAELTPWSTRSSDASLIVIWAENVATTHCKQLRWSTRLISAWQAKQIQAGRTVLTSSLWQPERCAKSWLTTPRVRDLKNAAAARSK